MKVLLVEPPISPFDVPTGFVGLPEPLALETVAADMCKNHDVTILDMRLEPEGLERCLLEVKPQIVGVGSVTANLFLAKQVLQKAKDFDPQILTMIGGHHVTFLPQDANENYIDVIVIGEGDRSADQVVDAFDKKESFSNIPGLVINHQGQQHRTHTPALLDMSQLQRPARHLVAKYRQQYFQRAYRPIVSINSSRGCPNRCYFCSLWKMNQGKYRTRSADLVADEIAGFDEEFVDFIDDNSIEDVSRAERLAELLIQKGVHKKLKMYGRADTVAQYPQLIEKLAEAGLEMLLVGFEAVRQDKLKDWNKRCTMEINQRAIEILHKNRVKIISYFLVDPAFDLEDFKRLWSYVDEMNLMDPVFTVLIPFPGTDFYEKENHRVDYKDYRLYDFFHSVFKPRLPLSVFYEQFSLLYQNVFDKQQKLARQASPMRPEFMKAQAAVYQEVFKRIRALPSHHGC